MNKMIDLFKKTFRYIFLHMLKYIPWTQEMCSDSLAFVPDRLKTQEMCTMTVEVDPYTLRYVPVHLRTQEMCEKGVEKYLYSLKFVPDHPRT